jgi:hypothetical protein
LDEVPKLMNNTAGQSRFLAQLSPAATVEVNFLRLRKEQALS